MMTRNTLQSTQSARCNRLATAVGIACLGLPLAASAAPPQTATLDGFAPTQAVASRSDSDTAVVLDDMSMRPGDLNCDGSLEMMDINAFVLAISDPTTYASTYPDCSALNADVNGDELLNFSDIIPFVDVMSGDAEVLDLEFDGLEPLGPDYVYEGWLIVGGNPVSTGRFTVDPDGNTHPTHFLIDPMDAANAAAFVLTIEPLLNDPPAPAATHVLAGGWSGTDAMLDVGHPAALGDDFTGAMGAFILETPTTSGVAGDYDQGIWYLDPGAGPGPSLVLPALPAGWEYEGWIVAGGVPISTGRFLMPTGADSDGAGPDRGPDGAPPFPGQDFINPPLVLTGTAAVISVEPEPDDSPAPFALKPLVDMTVEDVGAGTLQVMMNNAGSAPTGTAMLF